MSKPHDALPVIEWSPAGVRAWIPGRPEILEFDSLDALSQAGILPNGKVGAAVGRRHIFLKQIRLPNTTKPEAAMVLARRMDQILPMAGASLASDFHFLPDTNSEGRLAIVAAMKVDDLQKMRDEFKSAGLKIQWISPSGLGSFEAVKSLGLSEAVVLEPTPDGLAIDVVQNGSLAASRMAGTRANAIDVAMEVNRTKAAYGLSDPAIIAAGGLSFAEATHKAKESTLQNLHGGLVHFNLETPEDVKNKEQKAVNGRRSMAVLFVIATLCVAAIAWDERDTTAQKIAKIEKAAAKHKQSIENSKKLYSSRLTGTGQGAKVILNAFKPAQSGADVISVAASLLPDKAWLTGVTFDRGRRLQLRGTAMSGDSVANYVDALTAQSRFRDVQLVFANNTKLEETPVVQFSITAHVVGNFPLMDKNQKKGARS